MYIKSKIALSSMTIICISIFALTSVVLTPNEAFADERGRRVGKQSRVYQEKYKHARRKGKRKRHVISPRVKRHGHVISRLPRGYRRTWHKRRPYYYNRGVFYRPARSGFTVVGAPYGAVIISLPIGYQRLWIDNSAYYVYGSTFYRRVPAGYAVVERPTEVIVEDVAPALVQPSSPATGEVFVDAPVLNVRSGPSLTYPKIYQIDEGYILEVNGRSNGWLYVQLPNEEYGWVKSVFTKPVEPASG
jgi:hypothetical protein